MGIVNARVAVAAAAKADGHHAGKVPIDKALAYVTAAMSYVIPEYPTD